MKMEYGKAYHIQMGIGFLINQATNNWKILKPFSSIKNQEKAILALQQMKRDGFEVMPCGCKKTTKDGHCLGFSKDPARQDRQARRFATK